MAATAQDNIVLFPEGGRAAPGNGKLLWQARELMAQGLREALGAMLDKVAADLAERGDRASDREVRTFLYDLRDLLLQRRAALEDSLAACWSREFEADSAGGKQKAPTPSFDALQLIELRELEEDLAQRAFGERLRECCEEDLYAVGCRLSALSGRDADAARASSTAAELVAIALRRALADADFAAPQRLELMRAFLPHVGEAVAPVYQRVNAQLVAFKVLPDLKRSYERPQAARPPQKSGPAGAAGGAAAATADGDVFSLLQRLVAQPSGGSPGAQPAGGSFGAQLAGGSPGAPLSAAMVSGSAPMPPAVGAALAQVFAELDAFGHRLPGFGAPASGAPSGAASGTWASRAADAGAMDTAGMAGVAAAPANVLHRFRQSETGQALGQLDAITVDIVAMLFDLIFDDRAIADPIKALVARLQIPVLKVAMLDKTFFSSRAHPARRLLDTISRAAVRLGAAVDHGDPLYRELARIVARLQQEFTHDAGLFEELIGELDRFLREQEQAADAKAASAVPLVEERERQELAAAAADQALAQWLRCPLPAPVAELLGSEWRMLLIRYHAEGALDAWQDAIATAGELVWSIEAKTGVARKALVDKLPGLIRKLHEGLERIAVEPGRRAQLVDALFALHAAILRGHDAPAPALVAQDPAGPAELEIAQARLENGDTVVDSLSVAAASLSGEGAPREVQELARGDWVEFAQADGDSLRYRLAWVSPQRGIFLFTNPHLPRAVAASPQALALKIRRGEATLLSPEPIFERAVSRALDSLKAA